MSKVLRVVAVVASLAATVGSLGAFGGIALAIVGAVATVAAIGAQLLQKRPERAERQAQEISLSLGEQPRTVLFGDAVTGGGLLDAFNYGGKYGTDWEMLVLALADHECAELTGIYVNNDFVAFGGDGDVAGYNGKLKLWWRPGTENQDLPGVVSLNGPGWTANDNLAGVCFAVVAYKSDQPEEENPTWPGGRPSFRFRLKGKKLYDPRKDSTVAGGSGLHRWADPATREWSDNAALCRYNYQRGIFALEKVAEPDQLLLGRGLSAIEAPPERAMVWANLCDEDVPLKAGGTEKRYRINGVISTDENFLDAEQKFAAAMAGIIMQPEGSIEVEPGHAKSVIAEFTDADILNLESVVVEKFRSEADSEWYNMVVPRYVEPSQNWKMHGGPIRRVYADVIEDGGVREAPLSHELVTSATQSQRCAEIVRRMGRLTKTGQVSLPPRFIHVEEGDWIGWTSDRHFEGSRVVFRVEKFNRSEKWHMSLVLREISSTVFGWDPDVDELTGGAEATNQTEPPAVGQPGTDAWTLTAGSVASPNGTQPALEISGAVDDDYASAVRFEYKKVADADWSDAGSSARTTTRKVIAPVSPNTQYIIGVTYTVDGEASERRTYGPVTTGNLTIDFANVGDIPGELTDGRIPAGLDTNGNLISGINTGGPLEVTVEELAGNQFGNELAPDPDFVRGGLTAIYNNEPNSSVTQLVVSDTNAPNASKKKVIISYDGIGPTAPGFGGFSFFFQPSSQARPGHYVEGAVIQYYIIAKIPVGRDLFFATNPYGTGGTFEWLTSVSGSGEWKTYMAKQVIGYGGTLSVTGYFYIAGGANVAFDWEVARASAIHQGVAPRSAVNNSLIDNTGNFLTEGGIITAQGNSAGFIGEGALARENAIDIGGAFATGELPVGKANAGLRNTNILIGADGLLAGGGGGQVTYPGLGGKALGLKDILTYGDAEFREVGGTVATLGNFKTSLGNSLGFIGEGVLARKSNVFLGGPGTLGEGILIDETNSYYLNNSNAVTALGNSLGFIGEGVLARLNSADWAANVTGTGKPSDNAGTTLSFTHNNAYLKSTGNKIEKISGGAAAWDSISVSNEFHVGTAFFSGIMNTPGSFLGFYDVTYSPFGSASYPAIAFGAHWSEDGNWYIFQNGGLTSSLGAGYSAATQWTGVYDGNKFQLYADGVAVGPATTTTTNRILKVGVCLVAAGYYVSNIQFGPFSDRSWDNIGGTLKPENSADVTKSVSGPAEIILDYDSTGALTTALPATSLYKLTPTGGAAYTAGVTWSVSVLSGTFSGTAPSISGSGTGQLAINPGLSRPEALLAVTATYGGKSYPPVAVKVKKVVAPPATGGGGGSSASASVSSFSTTSFAAVTPELEVTLPAGVTTATLTASSIGLYLASAAPGGDTQVEMKWQRETSPGVWADVGTVATSSPHPTVVFQEGLYDPLPGSITCNKSATGLSAGSTQTFRLMARCSAGNTRLVTSNGTGGVTS